MPSRVCEGIIFWLRTGEDAGLRDKVVDWAGNRWFGVASERDELSDTANVARGLRG